MAWRLAGGLAVALVLLAAAPQAACAAGADNLHDLMRYLQSCLKPTGGAVGTELTIRFSLKRDGSLLGKPQISFSKSMGDQEEQRRFAEGTAAAFGRCLPAPVTDALGGAIAGRPFSLRFIIHPHETDI